MASSEPNLDCPFCGSTHPATAKFCGKTGTPLQRNCPRCSEEIPVQDEFCSSCGADITFEDTKAWVGENLSPHRCEEVISELGSFLATHEATVGPDDEATRWAHQSLEEAQRLLADHTEFESRKKRIHRLVEDEDYYSSLWELESIERLASIGVQADSWIKSTKQELQESIEEIEVRREGFVQIAREQIAAKEYDEAETTLLRVPQHFRNDEVTLLLEETRRRKDRVGELMFLQVEEQELVEAGNIAGARALLEEAARVEEEWLEEYRIWARLRLEELERVPDGVGDVDWNRDGDGEEACMSPEEDDSDEFLEVHLIEAPGDETKAAGGKKAISKARYMPSLAFLVSLSVVGAVAILSLIAINEIKRQNQPSIEQLMAKLKDSAPMARSDAAFSLGQAGTDAIDSIPLLVSSMTDPHKRVREQAMNGLAMIGEPAIPALLDAMSQDGFEAKWRVTSVLGRIGKYSDKCTTALVLMLSHADERTRVEASFYLNPGRVKLGTNKSQVIRGLTKVLRDDNTHVQINAARALGEIGQEAFDSLPELTRLLEDASERLDVRRAAADAWVRIGDTSEPADVLALDEAVVLIARRLDSSEWSERKAAHKAIARIGPKARLALPTLNKLLFDPDSELRSLACKSIGAMGGEATSSVPLLLRAFRERRSGFGSWEAQVAIERSLAYDAIGAIGGIPSPSVSLLLQSLRGGRESRKISESISGVFRRVSPRLRLTWEIVETISRIGPKAIPLVLREMNINQSAEIIAEMEPLKETDLKLRSNELDTQLLNSLSELLRSSSSDAADAAAGLLNNYVPTPLLPAVKEYLIESFGKSEVYEPEALSVIVKMGAPVLPLLLESMSHSNPNVRLWSAVSLEEIGVATDEVVACLRKGCSDPNRSVRMASSYAIFRVAKDLDCALRGVIEDLSSGGFVEVIRASDALAAMTPSNVGTLRKILNEQDDELINGHVCLLLSNLGKDAKSAIPDLRKQWEAHPNEVLTKAAALALGEISDKPLEYAPTIVASLTDEVFGDWPVRVLVSMGRRSVPFVNGLLESKHKRARHSAAIVLAHLGENSERIRQTLMEALMLSGPLWLEHEQLTPAGALMRTGVDALPDLLHVIQNESLENKRKAIILVPRVLDEEHTPDATQALIGLMGVEELHYSIEKSLALVGKPAVPGLIEVIRTGPRPKQSQALEILAGMALDNGNDGVFGFLEVNEDHNELKREIRSQLRSVSSIIAGMTSDFDDQQTLIWLGALAVPALACEINPDLNPDESMRILRTLERMQDEAEAAIPWLSELLENHPNDYQICSEALSVMTSIGSRAIPALVTASLSDREPIRKEALWRLKQVGIYLSPSEPVTIVNRLAKAIEDPSQRIAEWALVESSKLVPSYPGLVQIIISRAESNNFSRELTLSALANLGETAEEAIPFLRSELSKLSDNDNSRRQIIWTLSRISVPAVAEILQDCSVRTRELILRMLKHTKADVSAALPAVLEIMDAPDLSRSEMHDALVLLERMGPGAVDALPTLLGVLRNPKHSVDAVQVIGEMGPKARDALPELIRRVRHNDDFNAAIAITKILVPDESGRDKTGFQSVEWKVGQ